MGCTGCMFTPGRRKKLGDQICREKLEVHPRQRKSPIFEKLGRSGGGSGYFSTVSRRFDGGDD